MEPMKRRLGRSGIEVSALGLGTARIGGLGWREDETAPESVSADVIQASVRAIHRAVDLGVTVFDTADTYGAGHSERILGQALTGKRDRVVIVTKFGENAAQLTPEEIVAACEASLQRLKTDTIDIYLLHRRDYDLAKAGEIRETLERLVDEGKIRYYGWSTDDVDRARMFAEGPHCVAIEHRLNIFNDNTAMLNLCEQYDLASLNRVPLLMGVLGGHLKPDTKLPAHDRRSSWLQDEGFLRVLAHAERLRPVLTEDGRSYVQGALAWIWAHSERTIPLPGFRRMEQVDELAAAMRFGPLSEKQMHAVDEMMRDWEADHA
jgi:aryl-alcohol dehydrogenase-like predicted oxidoreductase